MYGTELTNFFVIQTLFVAFHFSAFFWCAEMILNSLTHLQKYSVNPTSKDFFFIISFKWRITFISNTKALYDTILLSVSRIMYIHLSLFKSVSNCNALTKVLVNIILNFTENSHDVVFYLEFQSKWHVHESMG